jgi:hypothetical protein
MWAGRRRVLRPAIFARPLVTTAAAAANDNRDSVSLVGELVDAYRNGWLIGVDGGTGRGNSRTGVTEKLYAFVDPSSPVNSQG